jgi:hypothetical protein
MSFSGSGSESSDGSHHPHRGFLLAHHAAHKASIEEAEKSEKEREERRIREAWEGMKRINLHVRINLHATLHM